MSVSQFLFRAAMILSFVLVPMPGRAQDICVSTPEGKSAAMRLLAEVKQLQNASPVPWREETKPFMPRKGGVFEQLQQLTPWGTPLPPQFVQNGERRREQEANAEPKELSGDEFEDISKEVKQCYGEYRCVHDKLHPFYKSAFAKLGCHCHTGRCRPTLVRKVALSDTNKTGLKVLVSNGQWCDVPEAALKRDGNKIPPTLLQFEAHVCVAIIGCGEMECVIADIGG